MAESIAKPHSRVASIVGLVLALGVGFGLPGLPHQTPARLDDVGQDTAIVVFEWLLAIALLAIVLAWERRPLRSIGFRALSWRDGIAIGIAFAAMYIGFEILAALSPGAASEPSSPTPAQIAAVPLVLRVVLSLTAGFCEELTRAYAIERVRFFTGQLWPGAVLATVLFTLAHTPRYGFTAALLEVAVISVCITALYWYTRNVFACAVMHASIDLMALVLGPAFAARALS